MLADTSSHQPVRWGILSAANIGVKRVAPAIQASSNGRLVAVGSRNAQRARGLFTFAPEVRIYGDYACTQNGRSRRCRSASMCSARSRWR
jgi:hypothetical protein